MNALGDLRAERSCRNFLAGEIAKRQKQIVDAVSAPGLVAGFQPLKLTLDVVYGLGVEQFTELCVTNELAELRLVDRQCL